MVGAVADLKLVVDALALIHGYGLVGTVADPTHRLPLSGGSGYLFRFRFTGE